MPTPPTSSRAGCPELELLAAFVEGRLVGSERDALVAHLAGCDACREIVAEAAELAAGLSGSAARSAAEVVPFPEKAMARRRPSAWIVLVAALALVTAAVLLQRRRPDTEAALADLGESADITARLDTNWSEPLWSITRGEGPQVSDRARAFRLGVRGADLYLAIRVGDRGAARRLAAECAWLLTDVPLADPVAAVFRELAERLAEPGVSPPVLLDSAATGRQLAREALAPGLYDLGRWSETARLQAIFGASARTPKSPTLPSDLPVRMRELAERAARPELGPSATPSVEALTRLVEAGGNMR